MEENKNREIENSESLENQDPSPNDNAQQNTADGDTPSAPSPEHQSAPTVKKKKRKKKKPVKKEASFKEKLALLWQDKRSFKKRFLLSLLASGAFVFTFFIFGPSEIYLSNMSFFAFSPADFFIPIIGAGLLMVLVISLLTSLLRGAVFSHAVSLVFSVTLAGYIQGNFLNIDHGSLDGHDVIWQDFKLQAFLGLLIWAIVIASPLILRYFSKKIWKRTVAIVSAILIGAQLVALGALFIKPVINHAFTDTSKNGYLSHDGIFTLGKSKNVVVFMLDRFDKEYMEHQLTGYKDSTIQKAADPDIAKGLSGFTFYTNFTGSYSRTFPSVAYLLTGVHTDYSIPYNDYLSKAWSESTFLSDIKDAGYDCRVYSEINYMGGNSNNMVQEVNNAVGITKKPSFVRILSAMYSLSAFRYLPEFMKPYFHTYTGDFSYSYIYGDSASNSPYGINDLSFREKLLVEGISIEEEYKGSFRFYHMQGSHDPFTMDGDGNKASFSNYFDGRFEQTKGNLKIILQYIDMLKAHGVYDDTTIIITADHGLTGTYPELDHERLLSLLIKPAGADTSLPLARSNKQICQDNLRASISSYFGLEPWDGHRTIESIGEDEEMVRYFWMNGSNKARTRRDVNLVTYKIVGDANDFSNWEIVDKKPIKYPYYDAP